MFVIDGRFDPYEMSIYNLLKTIIFDEHVTNHTTIVRTNFEKFKKDKECEADVELMIKHGSEELAKIVEVCREKIVHVNNPPIEIDGADEDELEINRNKRVKSREKLLKHLAENWHEDYKPPKLAQLSTEIAGDYFQYLQKKEELQKELDDLRTRKQTKLNSGQASEIETNENKPSEFSAGSSKVELANERIELTVEKKEQTDNNQKLKFEEVMTSIEVKGKITQQKTVQLENKTNKLKKEIQEKEELVCQKVLKHIFNNYEGIIKIRGGDSLLDNIIEDWKINEKFIGKELTKK